MEVLHYNLDMTPESEWKIVSAGAFARDNLLYLQEAGHFISGANYYTVRKNLDSYLGQADAFWGRNIGIWRRNLSASCRKLFLD